VVVNAVVSGAQPYNGFDVIGTSGGDIQVGVAGYILFFLANASNPVYGSPVTGHSFASGEVMLCLPGGSYANANTSAIIELGLGSYALGLTTSQTALRGKAFLYASVSGASNFETYVDILSPGITTQVVPNQSSGVTFVPSPVSNPVDQVAAALSRLPAQFQY
jgi:hypothetical protein